MSNIKNLIITILAQDRPGVVQLVSDIILQAQGNWMQSSLSRLCGQFAGIIHVEIPQHQEQALMQALDMLKEKGITAFVEQSNQSALQQGDDVGEAIELWLEANDRAGIIGEISHLLAQHRINVEYMETACESASMAGYELFKAHLLVVLPPQLSLDDLQQLLESLSDDLIVNILALE